MSPPKKKMLIEDVVEEDTQQSNVEPLVAAPPQFTPNPAPAPAPIPFNPPETVVSSTLKAQEMASQAVKETEKKNLHKLVRSAVPVSDVAVIIGYKTKDGKREEVVHDINVEDDLRIVTCTHSVEEKMKACKEEGQLVGFEPTGEYILTLKVKYIRE